MPSQGYNSITITIIISALILSHFAAFTLDGKVFEVTETHIKYHANWTATVEELPHV